MSAPYRTPDVIAPRCDGRARWWRFWCWIGRHSPLSGRRAEWRKRVYHEDWNGIRICMGCSVRFEYCAWCGAHVDTLGGGCT